MDIGEKIITLRKKHNLTQERLAEKLGISRQTLSNWEGNITTPDLNQAKVLSNIFKVSLDELANNNLEIISSNHETDFFKDAIGKTCNLSIDDDFYDAHINCDTPVTLLDINDDFIKIEYTKGKIKCIKLIDTEMIVSIKVKGA